MIRGAEGPLGRVEVEGNILNLIIVFSQNPRANSILRRETVEAFCFPIKSSSRMTTPATTTEHCPGGPSACNKTKSGRGGGASQECMCLQVSATRTPGGLK